MIAILLKNIADKTEEVNEGENRIFLAHQEAHFYNKAVNLLYAGKEISYTRSWCCAQEIGYLMLDCFSEMGASPLGWPT
jgi:hypothetical protein